MEGIGAGSIITSGLPDKQEFDSMLRLLGTRLSDVRTCGDLVTKHGTALQRTLGELEQLDGQSDTAARIKNVNERATLFRISSGAMINVSTVHAFYECVTSEFLKSTLVSVICYWNVTYEC